jgi:hypothetical protein
MAFIPKGARWYLAELVIEYTVDGDPRNVVHVNMHLVEADSPEHAYEKAMALGRASEQGYANSAGREVRVVFRGLQNLDVIHDPLEDGAELAYTEKVAVPEAELRGLLRIKKDLGVFVDVRYKHDVPNYMPESVMQALEDRGFARDDIEGSR